MTFKMTKGLTDENCLINPLSPLPEPTTTQSKIMTITMNTIKDITSELAGSFEEKTRDNGEKFYCLKREEEIPSWINSELVHRIHLSLDDRFPDDWVYKTITFVLNSFESYNCESEDEMRDVAGEIADNLVDVYNMDLIRWLGLNLNNASLVDEAVSEGFADGKDVIASIRSGQYLAIERIAMSLISEIEKEFYSRNPNS
jgi:hypothetical protein